MENAVGSVFPGAVLRVAVDGREVFHRPFGTLRPNGQGAQVRHHTSYDVASLTKCASIATLIMQDDGNLVLKCSLGGAVLWNTESAGKGGNALKIQVRGVVSIADVLLIYVSVNHSVFEIKLGKQGLIVNKPPKINS